MEETVNGAVASTVDTLSQSVDAVITLLATYGMSVIGAILILVVGWSAAGWLSKAAAKGMAKTGKVDDTLCPFLASMVKYAVIAFTVIAVLNRFGVETTSLVAVFGAAGLAIGLALQGTLSNVAAGVMLLLFRPFKVGQYVAAGGEAGTVKAITLFTTELATPDNVQIILPNASVWGSSVTNYSAHVTRRQDFIVGIAYEDDINIALAALGEVADGDARIMRDPEPYLKVHDLGDSSVNLLVRIWCASSDYWDLKFDMQKAMKEKLDTAGVTIPFPQRVVHVQNGNVQEISQAAE